MGKFETPHQIENSLQRPTDVIKGTVDARNRHEIMQSFRTFGFPRDTIIGPNIESDTSFFVHNSTLGIELNFQIPPQATTDMGADARPLKLWLSQINLFTYQKSTGLQHIAEIESMKIFSLALMDVLRILKPKTKYLVRDGELYTEEGKILYDFLEKGLSYKDVRILTNILNTLTKEDTVVDGNWDEEA